LYKFFGGFFFGRGVVLLAVGARNRSGATNQGDTEFGKYLLAFSSEFLPACLSAINKSKTASIENCFQPQRKLQEE
jgi:hypothetical protein